MVSAAGLVAGYLLLGRAPAIGPEATLVLRVPGDLAETEPRTPLASLLPGRPTLRETLETLRRARSDPRVSALVIEPAVAGALWGKLQEVRDAIVEFRTSGKPVTAYLQFGGEQDYYLATAADRIVLMPTSPLDVNGLATYDVFFRGTLDWVGAYPDLLHIGEYKTAANTFTETGYTPAHRAMAESLTEDTFEQLVLAIAEGRGRSATEVRALIDRGPFLAEDALASGLVDALAYEDEIGEEDLSSWVDAETYGVDDGARLTFGADLPRVAVIYVVGTIASGHSQEGIGGSNAGSDTIIEAIRQVAADDTIDGVVLRIDSPGGSAVASDAIWRALTRLGADKPLVASMSDLAASGGYYVAIAAPTIVAQPATLTGSIGIVAGKFVMGGALEKLGTGIESVSRGRFAELNSPARPYSPEEQQKVAEHMRAFYDQFVSKVASARGRTPAQIDAVAQGRVWTGRQALDVGLVDQLGGLSAAIEVVRGKAGIDPAAEVEIVVYPRRRSVLEAVASPWDTVAAARTTLAASLLHPEERRVLAALERPLAAFRAGELLAIMPNVFWMR